MKLLECIKMSKYRFLMKRKTVSISVKMKDSMSAKTYQNLKTKQKPNLIKGFLHHIYKNLNYFSLQSIIFKTKIITIEKILP